jgi:DNA polymerase-3 subunit delta'
MNDLLLHPATEMALSAAIEGGTHALMLVGPLGTGKLALARYAAVRLLKQRSVNELDRNPYFRTIGADNVLSIDQIRELQGFLRLKTTGTEGIRRVVILENAHLMTVEAQNALLKILEEPPLDTVIILTVQGEHSLRPTIYSRVQKIAVNNPPLEAAIHFFTGQGRNANAVKKAYLVSGGTMGLLSALLEDDTGHQFNANITLAKELLAAKPYERLLRVDVLGKAKENIRELLYALKRVADSALEQSALRKQEQQLKRWHRVLGAIYDAEATLPANPNIKLLLTHLFLSM